MDGTRRSVAVGQANRVGRSVDHMWLAGKGRRASVAVRGGAGQDENQQSATPELPSGATSFTEPYFRSSFGYSLPWNMF
jgi:hypothetical protein